MDGRIPEGAAPGPSCLVVGAGIAGLTAAQRLQAAGFTVTIVDKARGVGGRMATRRFAGGVFDHGAQFFTVRHSPFRSLVDEWLAAGVAVEWTRGFGDGDGHPRFRGSDGMTAPAKALARNLDIHLEQHVSRLTLFDWRWHAFTRQGEHFEADALLLTLPVPQAMMLLDHSPIPLPRPARAALESVRYAPTIAVLARLNAPSAVPAPGAIRRPAETISWLTDNQQKGISPLPAVTIHATHAFSESHFDADPAFVAERLLVAARPWVRADTVEAVDTQFWRYSEPVQLHPERHLLADTSLPLCFAGDAFGEARVEGAALSGLAAAEALIRQWREGKTRRPTGPLS